MPFLTPARDNTDDADATNETSEPSTPPRAYSAHRWWLIIPCGLAGALAGLALHARLPGENRAQPALSRSAIAEQTPSVSQQAANDRLLRLDAQLKNQLHALHAQAAKLPRTHSAPAVNNRLQILQQAILDTQLKERSLALTGDSGPFAAAQHREHLLRLSLSAEMKSFRPTERKAAESALLRQEIESIKQASAALDAQIAQQAAPISIKSEPQPHPEGKASPSLSPAIPDTLTGASFGTIVGLLLAALLGRKPTSPDVPADTAQPIPPHLTGALADSPYDPFQILAYSVLLDDWGKDIRSYAVTSISPGSGKSTVAANMGIVLSRTQLRVLLIDANFEDPTLHLRFELPNRSGLSDILHGQADLDPELAHATAYPGLFLITAGRVPVNPHAELSPDLLRQSLDRLSREFDLILIDLPTLSAEALRIAAECQGTVLVLAPGEASLESTRTAIESLAARNIHLCDSGINDLRMAS